MSRFIEHIEVVQDKVGEDPLGTGEGLRKVKAAVNEAKDTILGDRNWMFMRTFDVRATYPSRATATGETFTVTRGDVKVTAAGGFTFHLGDEGGVLAIVDGDYLRIHRVVSTTEIELEYRYIGTTNAAATGTVYQDIYPLPYDYGSMIKGGVSAPGTSNRIIPITRSHLERLWASSPSTSSQATRYIDDVYRKRTLWDTGTITVTKDSDAITGAATDWENALLTSDLAGDVLEGHAIRVLSDNDPNINGVRSMTTATAGLFEDTYRPATETGLSYEIGFAGSRYFQIWPLPTGRERIVIAYEKSSKKLIGDNDLSPIPPRWDYVVNSLAAGIFLSSIAVEPEQVATAQRWINFAIGSRNGQIKKMRKQDWPTQGRTYRLRKYGLAIHPNVPAFLIGKAYEVIAAP